MLVSADEVPIDIRDLGYGRDHLVFESDVRDLFVVLSDPQIAQVGPKSESSEKLLLDGDAILRVQDRRQIRENAIGRLASVVETKGKTRARCECLDVVDVKLSGIGLQSRYAVER